MRIFSRVVQWLKDITRPLRQALPLARLPEQSSIHDIPAVIGLAGGRLFGREHIRLAFSSSYAYKFRYLHRGLMQLAATGAIRYSFLEYDPSLGRKTAVIRYDAPGVSPVTGVIDGSSATWQLGQPDIDFDRVFGDRQRILFKLKYGLEHIHDRSSGREGQIAPPIGELYDLVLDGAYWPENARFLDDRWAAQQRRHPREARYDVTAIYGLYLGDLGGIFPDGEFEPSERVRFLLEAHRLEALGLSLKIGARIRMGITRDQMPEASQPYLIEQFLPFDEYLDVVFQSRMLYCPKSFLAERTYRLAESLALGCVCLSSPVRLHFDFEPGVHYVAIKGDFSDLEEVVTHYANHPDELEGIRRNVIPLYGEHLSPIGVARYYLRTLRRASVREIPDEFCTGRSP